LIRTPPVASSAPIFLDHNAGTPVDPRVLERFLEVERRCPGNPASLHAPGRLARAEVEAARDRIACALGVAAADVLFTSGGTEANNLAVLGLGPPELPVLLAAVEHPSVREPAARRGVVEWAVGPDGRACITAPPGPVGLVCLVHGQSEVGTLQDVVAAAGLANKIGAPLHVDAAQTLGRVDLREPVAVAASLSLSPHKAGGLRGCGVLIVRGAAERLRPLLRGGGQEHGLRPGTVAPALAAATALAVELAVQEQPARAGRMLAARTAFWQVLAQAGLDCQVLTPTGSLPNTLMLAVSGIDGRSLLPALDLAGIAISQGSACSSGSPLPPRVLQAMGLAEPAARRCVRVSFGRDDDRDSGTRAGAAFAAAVRRLQKKN
jgi:cysteine desulfurase